jgi:hypothetical protein
MVNWLLFLRLILTFYVALKVFVCWTVSEVSVGLVLQFAVSPLSSFSEFDTRTFISIYIKGASLLSLALCFAGFGYLESFAQFFAVTLDDFFLFPGYARRRGHLLRAVQENRRLQREDRPQLHQHQQQTELQHDERSGTGTDAETEVPEQGFDNGALIAYFKSIREYLTQPVTGLESGRWEEEERRVYGIFAALVKPLCGHVLPPLHLVPVFAGQVLYMDTAGYEAVDRQAGMVRPGSGQMLF